MKKEGRKEGKERRKKEGRKIEIEIISQKGPRNLESGKWEPAQAVLSSDKKG
jgi:hypothetical protein